MSNENERISGVDVIVGILLLLPLYCLKGVIFASLFNLYIAPVVGVTVTFVFGVGVALITTLFSVMNTEYQTRKEYWTYYVSRILLWLTTWGVGILFHGILT